MINEQACSMGWARMEEENKRIGEPNARGYLICKEDRRYDEWAK